MNLCTAYLCMIARTGGIFYFIGNSDSEEMKREQEFVEHTLDKLLSGHEVCGSYA